MLLLKIQTNKKIHIYMTTKIRPPEILFIS